MAVLHRTAIFLWALQIWGSFDAHLILMPAPAHAAGGCTTRG